MGLPLHRTRRRGSCYTEQAFFPLRFMQGQFLCQASRYAQFFRKPLSEKDHRPRSSAEGRPCVNVIVRIGSQLPADEHVCLRISVRGAR